MGGMFVSNQDFKTNSAVVLCVEVENGVWVSSKVLARHEVVGHLEVNTKECRYYL